MQRPALYRKNRPADFDDVVGQAHITASLTGALQRGLVSHAYLFTGPHGTGKTSVARILARRINELPADADISSQLDIIEIDAASNRGIDEIRALRERISSAPSTLKYKVYIIDEVHMLTREAFNALLKTLEEPPEHAIFIMATTEAHKLPETIISRTQRFDFRPIGGHDIVERLRKIAKQEQIKIDDEAIEIIARASQGGLRDAISLLDQLSVYDRPVDTGLVYEILGLSPVELVDKLLQALTDSDLKTALEALQTMLDAGADPVLVTEQIIDRLRQKFLAKQDESSPDLISLLDNFTQALRDFKLTQQYSLPLELALYRSCVPRHQATANATELTIDAQPIAPVKAKKSDTPAPAAAQVANWESLYTKSLSYIKTKNNSLYAVLKMAEVRFEDDTFIFDFHFSFHRDRVEESKNRNLIETVLSKAFGRPITVVCELAGPIKSTRAVDPEAELVSSALEILGGEVID